MISVKDYKSTGEFHDELSFPKHAVMKVIYKTLDGWWYVRYVACKLILKQSIEVIYVCTCRYNETNGYVPAAYLKTLNETQTFGSETEKEQVMTDPKAYLSSLYCPVSNENFYL